MSGPLRHYLALVKTSLLILYHRIFGSKDSMRITIYIVMSICWAGLSESSLKHSSSVDHLLQIGTLRFQGIAVSEMQRLLRRGP
jgi:hypothetical protein